jgi:hypothetical protein
MPVKKTAAAVGAAIQQGLNVRGTKPVAKPVKATKAAVAKVTKTAAPAKVAKTASKIAVTKDDTGAVTGLVGPRKVAKTPQVAASDKLMWTDTTDRATAHRAIVRHAGDSAPIRGTQSYWAEANTDIRRFGKPTLPKGTWLLAFDVMIGDTSTTVYFDVHGELALLAKGDDKAKIDRFTYHD